MKKVGLIILIVFFIILLLFGIFLIYLSNKINKLNYVDIPKYEIQIDENVEKDLIEYRNIALFGIDTRENTYDGSRTDCIIIASINEKTKQVKLVSVYRDTYLEISGRGLDKVNHAYAYGGPKLSMSTLNSNLDLDISEFVTLNFTATKDIIDEIGGVEIELTSVEATKVNGIETGGKHVLNGEQALEYSRIRFIDSDYVRTERMRTVLEAVFEKMKNMNTQKLNQLADKLLPEIYTNISKNEIMSLIPKIKSYSIIETKGWPYETKGIMFNNVWYGPPVNLEKNVVMLHKDLFGEDNYQVTDNVKRISTKIINVTGYK